AWLYLGSGWGWVSRIGGVPTRKLVGIGEIYIEPLLPGNGALAFDATADKDTTLILTHADQAIGSCSLAANMSATCVVAPFALQQGANKLSLAAAPGSAPASITISHLAYHFDQ
ncbi:MAG: hypothetical protein LLG44_04025, partial [Chloroflexi bacterium]|nr:hypothetical protein [Chloroflexota bacterium]